MKTEDIKVALCGNAKGQDYVIEGSFDENLKRHIDSLYRDWGSRKTDFLIAEIKINEKNEADFYYSYIRPNTKECGQEGREGGCCAIILRTTKHYCEDMARLYQLFAQLFTQLVEGTFIRGNQFIVEKFGEYKANRLLAILRGQIDKSFKDSFSLLKDKVYISGKTLECNVSAYGCELYLDDFFKSGSAILSEKILKEVPKLQKTYQQKLNEQEQKHNTELEIRNKEIEAMKKQKMSDDKLISELTKINGELKEENQRQQKRLKTVTIDAETKDAIFEILHRGKRLPNGRNPQKPWASKLPWGLINSILSLIVVVLLCLLLFKPSNAPTQTESNTTETETSTTETEVTETETMEDETETAK